MAYIPVNSAQLYYHLLSLLSFVMSSLFTHFLRIRYAFVNFRNNSTFNVNALKADYPHYIVLYIHCANVLHIADISCRNSRGYSLCFLFILFFSLFVTVLPCTFSSLHFLCFNNKRRRPQASCHHIPRHNYHAMGSGYLLIIDSNKRKPSFVMPL